MGLKAELSSLEGLGEAIAALYVKGDDGVYRLDVDGGLASKSKLNEFRDNNRELFNEKKELTEKLAKLNGLDPEKYREMQEKLEKLNDKELLDAGKVDELVEQKTERMRQAYEEESAALKKARDEALAGLNGANGQLAELIIDNELISVATANGVRKSALQDIKNRGKALWQLKDGKAVPLNGDSVVYGKDGDPLSMKEWVGGLQKEAPHLFEKSGGGGAQDQTSHRFGEGGQVSVRDQEALNSNLAKIASGEVTVGE